MAKLQDDERRRGAAAAPAESLTSSQISLLAAYLGLDVGKVKNMNPETALGTLMVYQAAAHSESGGVGGTK
jgi:hypothetical protein